MLLCLIYFGVQPNFQPGDYCSQTMIEVYLGSQVGVVQCGELGQGSTDGEGVSRRLNDQSGDGLVVKVVFAVILGTASVFGVGCNNGCEFSSVIAGCLSNTCFW